MRMAGSLKLGTIHASELIRSLLRSSRPSGLAQAIMEVGRVNKTLYLLNYIDDEDYRRRILTQLNWEKDAMQWLEPFATDNVVRLEGTVAKLAMRQPFVLFKGLTFQKLCLPGAFRPGITIIKC